MNIRTDIKLLPTASLREADTNAKKHTEEQVSTIARSIERFGFNVPLVVSKDNEVVAGHGRLFAAKKLGLTIKKIKDLPAWESALKAAYEKVCAKAHHIEYATIELHVGEQEKDKHPQQKAHVAATS